MGTYNITLQTLLQQLRSILQEYNSDQILKELVQNAEDARATTVKFLLDERTFAANFLHNPELSKFQGPALYAFNDAEFKESDWESLSHWGNSVKNSDRTKIGRFGLGFKSVFHITDLPMIMSNDRVCMIDPHEKYFTKNEERCSGYDWRLSDNDSIVKFRDQFEPLRDVFHENTGPFEIGRKFEGTLFRFPLRRQASRVCDNVCTAENVRHLFSAFQKTAEQMLLFLMSVTCIELYVRDAAATRGPTLVFRVNIPPQLLHRVNMKRQRFLSEATDDSGAPSNKETSLVSILEFERWTRRENAADHKESSTYIVSHYYGCTTSNNCSMTCDSGNYSEMFRPEQISKRHRNMAWASTAAFLPLSRESDPHDFMALCPPSGQLFCFLPLPLQSVSPTGLPVHVNGFFALSSNRHEVKWPPVGDADNVDDDCQWNRLLVKNILPRAYANMVLKLVKKISRPPRGHDGTRRISRADVYSLFPDPSTVMERWKEMLSPFYGLIFNECTTFVQTKDNAGDWTKAENTLLPNLNEDLQVQAAAARCLANFTMPDIPKVASVPPHVVKAMQCYASPALALLTPVYLRTVLRRAPNAIIEMSNDDRLAILDFILKADDENYQELTGIPMIPLSNGSFTSLTSEGSSSELVFIDSPEHPHSLLPNSAKMFLDCAKIPETVKKKLSLVAESKKTNICHFNKEYFKMMSKSMVTEEDVIQDHYCKSLWNYLLIYFSSDLQEFEDFPFLLSGTPSGNVVHKLHSDRPLLLEECNDVPLNKNARDALTLLGVVVVSQIPRFIWNHPGIPNRYVFPPTPAGILEVLCILKKTEALKLDGFQCMSTEERMSLREKFSILENQRSCTDEQIDMLKALPLFELKGLPENYASVSKVQEIAPFAHHPLLPPHCRLLDAVSLNKGLRATLGVKQLGRTELFTKYIRPALETSTSQPEYVDAVMTDVLRNLADYEREDPTFPDQLSTLCFIPRQDGKLVTPSEAFDPKDSKLEGLLFGQNLYPKPPYDKPEMAWALERLGLCNITKLTSEQILECATTVVEIFNRSTVQEITQKSLAILKFLEEYHDRIDKSHFNHMKKINWLMPEPISTEAYPKSMPWFGANQVPVSPDDVYDIQHAAVVGSIAAVLPRRIQPPLSFSLGLDKIPSPGIILKHLQNAIKAYSTTETAQFLHVVCRAYDILQGVSSEELIHELASLERTEWVWHGSGFAYPERVVLDSTGIDCRPFIYVVPKEMQKYNELLTKIGVQPSLNNDILLDLLYWINEKYNITKQCTNDEEKINDRLLSINVLKKLAESWKHFSDDDKARLIIPIAGDELIFAPAEECTSTSNSDWLSGIWQREAITDEKPIIFVHPDVGAEVTNKLGIHTLSQRLLDSEKLFIGEAFGQSEPLTTRLKKLLETEYADGMALPKEFIQNADDAGATKVKFIYDERSNEDHCTGLIDEGMRECQGPALWVFNNSVFTDEDFQNITRISDARKAESCTNIGQFGLGFNVVYNVTDVPSFISGGHLVIFDPHKYHLGKALLDHSQPGIKVNLQKNTRALHLFRNQFVPYDGICGCRVTSVDKNTGVNFDGTLFRLPLRTQHQASKSKISPRAYDKEEVARLIEMLARDCRTVLLFTQNVSSVSVFHIPKDPRNPVKLFSVTKRLSTLIRKLDDPAPLSKLANSLSEKKKELVQNSGILRAAAMAKNNTELDKQQVSSLLVAVRYKETSDACLGVSFSWKKDESQQDEEKTWLVVSCTGKGESVTLAKKNQRLSPIGGVAALVTCSDDNCLHPLRLVDDSKQLGGRLFCFLPLPIKSDLPVHINGAFALHQSRRSLIEECTDEKTGALSEWNKCLWQDAVLQAYVILLEDLRNMSLPKTGNSVYSQLYAHEYHALWPTRGKEHTVCKTLVSSFYRMMGSDEVNPPEQLRLRLLSDGRKWVSLSESYMLDTKLRSKKDVSKAATHALEAYVNETVSPERKIAVIDMPPQIRKEFVSFQCDRLLNERTYEKVKLFNAILPMISRLHRSDRDTLILFALDETAKDDELKKLLQSNPCIPVGPYGETLAHIRQLVNPYSPIACLYSPAEGRFPFGDKMTYHEPLRIATLCKLGMLTEAGSLSEEELLQRASQSHCLYAADDEGSRRQACERAVTLLKIIEEQLELKTTTLNMIKDQLQKTQFLPHIRGRSVSTFKWKGDDVPSKLLSPAEIYRQKNECLLCYVEPLLDEERFGNMDDYAKAMKYLDLDRLAPIEAVIRQLAFVAQNRQELMDYHCDHTKKIVCSIYEYLQVDKCHSVDELKKIPDIVCIVVEDKLVQLNKVCQESLLKCCSPYLYHLPAELKKFSDFFCLIGMKRSFSAADFIGALKEMKDKHKENTLDEENLIISVNLAHLLFKQLQSEDRTRNQSRLTFTPPLCVGEVFLPDSRKQLQLANTLSYTDGLSINEDEEDNSFLLVHQDIPHNVARLLGVNTIEESVLRGHDLGLPFGQSEVLVNRLSRIMKAYPRDMTIFKELIQNADDAGATEINFIKDYRDHPTEKVLTKAWKLLQGPALCVHSNTSFTKEGLKGIQALGMGSKSSDPFTIGQYGVGFNCVYHLTDVPSFITNVEGHGEVLCAMDPNCLYANGANARTPGRMFKDLESLRRKFPDVFSCYLESEAGIKTGTLFRFPLRTCEMAKESQLCSSSFSTQDLDELLNKLKVELFELLPFLNNLTKIQISEVSSHENMIRSTYSVQASLSKEDSVKRRDFFNYARERTKELANKSKTLRELEMREVRYWLHLEDSVKKKVSVLLVQRIGFDSWADIETKIESAFTSNEPLLMPRGGVASFPSSTSENAPCNQREHSGRVFCFLPLPITTGLPVHVNGHFALDHESRRGLWLNTEDNDPRTEWNFALFREIIVPCYISLLKEIRDQTDEDFANSQRSLPQVNKILRNYSRYFPRIPKEEIPLWKHISVGLYRQISEKNEPLLPLLRQITQTEKGIPDVKLEWLPMGERCDGTRIYFDNIKDSDQQALKKLLVQAGMQWVEDPLNIARFFEQSGVEVRRVTPDAVLKFLRSSQCQHPVPLPCSLNKTIFHNESNFFAVLMYCLKDQFTFWSQAPGQPFALSQDNTLSLLTTDSKLFISEFHDLVPCCLHEFLNDLLRMTAFNKIPTIISKNQSMSTPVTEVHRAHSTDTSDSIDVPRLFKDFGATDLAERLHKVLHCECGRRQEYCPVLWRYEVDVLPSPGWLRRLWKYLTMLNDTYADERKTGSETLGIDMLQCLEQWPLIPAVKKYFNGTLLRNYDEDDCLQYLVTIQHRKAVFFYSRIKDAYQIYKSVEQALHSLSVLQLDETAFHSDEELSDDKGCGLLTQLVAKLEKPTEVINCVLYALQVMNENEKKNIKKDCFRTLLKHFATQNIGDLSEEEKSTFKKNLKILPFYERHDGNFIALANVNAAVLSDDIPKDDCNKWIDCVRHTLLRPSGFPCKLWKFLEVEVLETTQVYYQYIFDKFSDFSKGGQLAHLTYIRNNWLPFAVDNEERKDRTQLLNTLMKLKFLEGVDGNLLPARNYYDPRNALFRALWTNDRFPPQPYDASQWLDFLTEIGLKTRPDSNDVIELATIIANKGLSSCAGDTDLQWLASMLIDQLLSNKDLQKSSWLLRQLGTISFVITSEDIKSPIQLSSSGNTKLRQPRMIQLEGAVLYNEINHYCAWSTVEFLPLWTEKRLRRIDGFSYQVEENLGILHKPSLKKVFLHIENVISLSSESIRQQEQIIEKILFTIYKELQTRLNSDDSYQWQCFKKLAFIMLKNSFGITFVRADQLVINMQRDEEIQPYIIKAPQSLSEYHRLLQRLGAADKVNFSVYVSVLKTVKTEYKDFPLEASDIAACQKATYWLVRHLLSTEEEAKIIELFLLSKNCVLLPSQELVYNDEPSFADRLLPAAIDKPFLMDIYECKIERSDFEEAMAKIPKNLRPLSLFDIIEERLVEPEGKICVQATCGPSELLRKRLQSRYFVNGLWRLILHEHKLRSKKPDAKAREVIETTLLDIEVRGLPKLVTCLHYNKQMVRGSEKETDCFVQRTHWESEKERWIIYTTTCGTITMVSLVRVAEIIQKVAKGLLWNTELYLYPLLVSEPWNIERMLDKLRITPLGSSKASERPGSFVPYSQQQQLMADVFDFKSEEYVALELHDPIHMSQPGLATYIFVTIVDEVQDSSAQRHQSEIRCKTYRVQVGQEDCHTVSVLDLYRFAGVTNAPQTNVYYDPEENVERHNRSTQAAAKICKNETDVGGAGSKELNMNVLSESYPPLSAESQETIVLLVREQIEFAFELCEAQRIKIMKRLLLKFHPNKDVTNEDLLSAVTKEILDTYSRHVDVHSEASPSQLDIMVNLLDQRLQIWSRLELDCELPISLTLCGTSPSSNLSEDSRRITSLLNKNPQVEEGLRWLRQADADLNLASQINLFNASQMSSEWTCFICHQAAEKALKGAQFMRDWNDISTTDLDYLASGLNDLKCYNKAATIQELIGSPSHPARICYPSLTTFPQMPCEIYTPEIAKQVLQSVKDLVAYLKQKYFISRDLMAGAPASPECKQSETS